MGIEDNPEFKNYKNKRASSNSTVNKKGNDNPGFNKSIDEVTASENPFAGGTKTNPLSGINLENITGMNQISFYSIILIYFSKY